MGEGLKKIDVLKGWPGLAWPFVPEGRKVTKIMGRRGTVEFESPVCGRKE